MERLKRSFSFWALMLAVVALIPATLQANKIVFKAKIMSAAGKQIGSSVFQSSPDGARDVNASANNNVPPYGVQKVIVTNGTWEVVICENLGPPQDDCEYDATGKLLMSQTVTGSMLYQATNGPVTGTMWRDAFDAGQAQVVFLDAGWMPLGSGIYEQIFP